MIGLTVVEPGKPFPYWHEKARVRAAPENTPEVQRRQDETVRRLLEAIEHQRRKKPRRA